MIRTLRLFILLAVAFSLPSLLAAKGKPSKPEEQTRQHCIISGDIQSDGEVVVNLDYPNTLPLEDKNGDYACLLINGSLLDGLGQGDASLALTMKDGACAYGQVLIFKGPAGQNKGIFDFSFCPYTGCETPKYTNVDNGGTSQYLPHWIDGDPYCPYRLRILNGIYDRKDATLTFDSDARVELWDATLGVSETDQSVVGYCPDLPEEDWKPCEGLCLADPGLPECDCNCIDDYRVPTGSVGSDGILIHLLSD